MLVRERNNGIALKKLMFGVAIIFSQSAWASWTYIGKSPVLSDVTVYVDYTKGRKLPEKMVQIPVLLTSHKRKGGSLFKKGHLSSVTDYVFNCPARKAIQYDIEFYEEQMARGKIVKVDNYLHDPEYDDWVEIHADSVNGLVYNEVCRKQ